MILWKDGNIITAKEKNSISGKIILPKTQIRKKTFVRSKKKKDFVNALPALKNREDVLQTEWKQSQMGNA